MITRATWPSPPGRASCPSLDLAEAYAIVNYRGRHASVRAWRRLGVDRMNLHLGPIKPMIIQGLRLWRYVLEDNPWAVSYDFYFHTVVGIYQPLDPSAYEACRQGLPGWHFLE